MDREVVTVCRVNDQWGLWLPGCQEHVTNYRPSPLPKRGSPLWWMIMNGFEFTSKKHVLEAVKHIRQNWQREYNCPLPWRVEVIG